jgi:HEAT repeat protein
VARQSALRSGDLKSEVAAVFALQHVGTDEAVDALIECCTLCSGPPLSFAVGWLTRHDAHRAVPALVRCLEERRETLGQGDKQMIIAALAAAPHRSEIPVLTRSLHEPNRSTRNMAAHALARIRSPQSREALEAAANGPRDRQVRRALRLHEE